MWFIASHPSATLLESGDEMAGESVPGEAGVRLCTLPCQISIHHNNKGQPQFSAADNQDFPSRKPERGIPDMRFVQRWIAVPLTCRVLAVL